jgi:hypothetical protein
MHFLLKDSNFLLNRFVAEMMRKARSFCFPKQCSRGAVTVVSELPRVAAHLSN